MIRVLDVAEDGTGHIDLTGLFRVIIHPSEEIAEELVEDWEADAFCEAFNGVNKSRNCWAERVSYIASLGFSAAAMLTNSPTVLSV